MEKRLTIFAIALWVSILMVSCSDEGAKVEPEVPDAATTPDTAVDVAPDIPAIATFGTSACRTCVTGACPTEIAACGSEPECVAYLSCLDACPVASSGNADPTCEASCILPSASEARKLVLNLQACRSTGSGAACPECAVQIQTGGPENHPHLNQTCSPSSYPDPCGKCFLEKCCETFNQCGANAECLAIEDCVAEHVFGPFDLWVAGCMNDHPDGVADYLLDWSCSDFHCADACGFPSLHPAPCAECQVEYCTSAKVACDTNLECFLITLCVSACGMTDDCFASCTSDGGPASNMFEDRFICPRRSCGLQCDG